MGDECRVGASLGVSLGVHSVLEVHQLACGTCVEADKTIPSRAFQSPESRARSPVSPAGYCWSWRLVTILAELSLEKWRGRDFKFCDIPSWF